MAERKYKNPQVNLRLPEELKEKVSKLAEKHKRSANAEMVAAIEHWVEEYENIEENQKAIDIINRSPDIRDGSPIRDILYEFVEKVTPLLEQEVERLEKKVERTKRDAKKLI